MDNIKPKQGGTAFNINRPAYLVGSTKCGKQNSEGESCCRANPAPRDLSKINHRNGLGNYDITRKNFDASTIRGRIAGDFDRLQALDIETQGVKIQLSEKTIEELFKTKIADKTDTQWIAEKDRLTILYRNRGMTPDQIERELEVNKPLGREQRKITSVQNIGQANLTIGDKIREIKEEVLDGRAESRQQQAVLIGQLAIIFNNIQTVENFTRTQLIDLSQTVARLNLPRNHKQMGIEPRFIDNTYYNNNSGLINLFFFANVASDPTFNTPNGVSYTSPVLNFTNNPNGLPAIKLTSMLASMTQQGNGKRYLDLGRRGVISYNQMRQVVINLGSWDNSEIAVEPSNRNLGMGLLPMGPPLAPPGYPVVP